MDMDIHKHRAITNNHELYLYLLRMCDLRTAKFGLVVVFLFFLRVAGWWALALPVLGDLGLPCPVLYWPQWQWPNDRGE
mgnify:FL=1